MSTAYHRATEISERWRSRRERSVTRIFDVPNSTAAKTQGSLLDELESAIQTGSAERRLETLRRITDLFLGGSNKFNEDQIAVFDQVLGQLIRKIETRALAELSVRLAPIDNAPLETIRSLARNDDIEVAGPVLEESVRLTTSDLVEIARTKGQAHLLAISGRPTLTDPVTDVLVARGNMEVFHRLLSNETSSISAAGFAVLTKAAEQDELLAEKAGRRIDIPIKLLRDLLLRAKEAVRERLLAVMPAKVRDEVQNILNSVVRAVDHEVSQPRDYAAARRFVELLKEKGELQEKDLLRFAKAGQYEETVAALSLLASTPIDILKPLMQSPRCDGLLVPCRAADFRWETVSAILQMRFSGATLAAPELDRIGQEFAKLSKASAQRMLRFWKVRESTQASA
ncbi:DUF2336 domain-containing protein [Rhodopseudomonas palustris]|uniref:DUF2336 domain-containing protein n=1 Tax=Rhodopseudomonas palustris TaxID=1076 RepID=UPI00140239DA|nr:DUF2336 domain-containing protein [Rhodopseudomonas palustris]